MQEPNKEWFELSDIRKRGLSRDVWIPVYGINYYIKKGRYPDVGFIEDMLIVGSAIILDNKREEAEKLYWHSWSQDDNTPYFDDHRTYHEAGVFYEGSNEALGFKIVLSQTINSLHPKQVHLHQDFVLAYGLIQEDDKWLSPKNGYEKVVRIKKGDNGETSFVEINSVYLKDYLAARRGALRLYYYRQRQAVFKDDPLFNWPNPSLLDEAHNRCEVRCNEINSSGDAPGTSWTIFKAWRTDVDPDEDVPDFSKETDETTATKTSSVISKDTDRRYRVMGELWRGEWIEPADKSCLIGFEEPDEALSVWIDADVKRVDLKNLNYEYVGKYLWFKPEVINVLLGGRGASIKWYSSETGGVSASPDWLVHFGVNKLGLVNAYAYDIARRPLWERRIWIAHNSKPDGGVASELLEAQMKCAPAQTKAPEYLLLNALANLESVFQNKLSLSVLRDHQELEGLIRRVNRFRAIDDNGLRALAKDACKISIERLIKQNLMQALKINDSKLGTLKLLEELLKKYTCKDYASKRMAPVFGVYDLRSADAHLSSSDIDIAYKNIGIDRDLPCIIQGEVMLRSFANAIGITAWELNKHMPEK